MFQIVAVKILSCKIGSVSALIIGRKTDGLGKEDSLLGSQFEFLGCIPLIAIVEMSCQALRGGE